MCGRNDTFSYGSTEEQQVGFQHFIILLSVLRIFFKITFINLSIDFALCRCYGYFFPICNKKSCVCNFSKENGIITKLKKVKTITRGCTMKR